MKIYKNRRSGVIHTQNCGNLKQMLDENRKELEIVDPRHIEGRLQVCQHCLDQQQARKFMEWKYLHEMEKLEKQKNDKLHDEWSNFEHKRHKIAQKRDENLRKISENYQKKRVKLHEKYGD